MASGFIALRETSAHKRKEEWSILFESTREKAYIMRGGWAGMGSLLGYDKRSHFEKILDSGRNVIWTLEPKPLPALISKANLLRVHNQEYLKTVQTWGDFAIWFINKQFLGIFITPRENSRNIEGLHQVVPGFVFTLLCCHAGRVIADACANAQLGLWTAEFMALPFFRTFGLRSDIMGEQLLSCYRQNSFQDAVNLIGQTLCELKTDKGDLPGVMVDFVASNLVFINTISLSVPGSYSFNNTIDLTRLAKDFCQNPSLMKMKYHPCTPAEALPSTEKKPIVITKRAELPPVDDKCTAHKALSEEVESDPARVLPNSETSETRNPEALPGTARRERLAAKKRKERSKANTGSPKGSCGNCFFCQRGLPGQCEVQSLVTTTPASLGIQATRLSQWRSLHIGMGTDQVRIILGEPQQIVAYVGGAQWRYDAGDPSHALVVIGGSETIEAFVEPRNLSV